MSVAAIKSVCLRVASVLMVGCYVTVERDVKSHGRPLDQVLRQYMAYVKPAFEEFCLPVSSAHWITASSFMNSVACILYSI